MEQFSLFKIVEQFQDVSNDYDINNGWCFKDPMWMMCVRWDLQHMNYAEGCRRADVVE